MSYTGLDRRLGLQEIGFPRISRQSAHECGKVVSHMHRPPLTSQYIPGTHFCHRPSRSEVHNMARRIKSI